MSSVRSDGHGQLAPWQIRRVTDYFSAHLADDIQLQTASDLVRLSRSHFSRAFKNSTGLAPHQWLLQARIARAKQLMLETDLPLAQIAIGTGFADQAHFTRTFGRAAGQSPRAWQRARGT
jgi:AraC-like DNA-binding protein